MVDNYLPQFSQYCHVVQQLSGSPVRIRYSRFDDVNWQTDDLLLRMWNWSSSRKTGSVHLDLPPGAIITAARFVNELHQRIVVLAEISERSSS